MQMQTTDRAIMPAILQGLLDLDSASGASLARSPRINRHELTASFFRFARKDLSKLIPRGVCDRLSQVMIFEHPFNVPAEKSPSV